MRIPFFATIRQLKLNRINGVDVGEARERLFAIDHHPAGAENVNRIFAGFEAFLAVFLVYQETVELFYVGLLFHYSAK